jgi:hypothetical protein
MGIIFKALELVINTLKKEKQASRESSLAP